MSALTPFSSSSTGERKALNLTRVLTKLIRTPQTPEEHVVTVCIGVLSLVFIGYALTLCYKCMCSRNYAKVSGARVVTSGPRSYVDVVSSVSRQASLSLLVSLLCTFSARVESP